MSKQLHYQSTKKSKLVRYMKIQSEKTLLESLLKFFASAAFQIFSQRKPTFICLILGSNNEIREWREYLRLNPDQGSMLIIPKKTFDRIQPIMGPLVILRGPFANLLINQNKVMHILTSDFGRLIPKSLENQDLKTYNALSNTNEMYKVPSLHSITFSSNLINNYLLQLYRIRQISNRS